MQNGTAHSSTPVKRTPERDKHSVVSFNVHQVSQNDSNNCGLIGNNCK